MSDSAGTCLQKSGTNQDQDTFYASGGLQVSTKRVLISPAGTLLLLIKCNLYNFHSSEILASRSIHRPSLDKQTEFLSDLFIIH